MELKHDWRAFNSVLYPQEAWDSDLETGSKLVISDENGRVVDGIVSSGVRFADQGVESPTTSHGRLDSLASKYEADRTVVIQHKDVMDAVNDAGTLGNNYYQQLEMIRQKVMAGEGKARRGRKAPVFMVSRPHFVLDLLTSKSASRFLPRNYCFLIFLDCGRGSEFQHRALLIQMNQGKVDQFYEPDFSSLHENRLEDWEKQTDIIGEYLENRYLLPCFGIFMKKTAWDRCVQASAAGKSPWNLFARAHESGSAAVFPQTFGVKTLLATRKVMMYFSRE